MSASKKRNLYNGKAVSRPYHSWPSAFIIFVWISTEFCNTFPKLTMHTLLYLTWRYNIKLNSMSMEACATRFKPLVLPGSTRRIRCSIVKNLFCYIYIGSAYIKYNLLTTVKYNLTFLSVAWVGENNEKRTPKSVFYVC